MKLFIEYFRILFNIKPNDWSVIWSRSTKWFKEGTTKLSISFFVIYYSESRKEFSLEVIGKYTQDMQGYKQAMNELKKLKENINYD